MTMATPDRTEADAGARSVGGLGLGDCAAMATRLAGHPALHPAQVDELSLDRPDYRRPQRGEDFDLVGFDRPLDGDAGVDLRALTYHRLLFVAHELADGLANDLGGGPALGRDARAVLPALDRLCFASLVRHAGPSGVAGDRLDLAAPGFWTALGERAAWGTGVAALALQMQPLIAVFQRTPTLAARCAPLHCGAAGLVGRAAGGGVAASSGHGPGNRHVDWQFYLPTTLALANALRSRVVEPTEVAEAVAALLGRILRAAQTAAPSDADIDLAPVITDLGPWRSTGGPAAALAAGFAADLAAHLVWLSEFEAHTAFAARCRRRMATLSVPLPLDTFIEPRHMVSTTHVHDDHRLVIVETGEMVFWAVPGMRCRVKAGEAIYVPRGRLHGSSVLTETCRYHQPVIPEDWLANAPVGGGR
ncbi:hypothetical protein CCR80_03575 [Rhodothalassium salexigens]|nr:hypothetical protein [Rhodothalassium salexigens]